MGKLCEFLIKQNLLPKISVTENIALQAGSSWLEADIFTGSINWDNIMALTPVSLSETERKFIDGPVETLCHMVNDWDVQQSRRIPQVAIDYMHKEKFLGLMIPEVHGGLGFSNFAFSTILTKLASRNAYICLYVLIPNSVGPGELIESYGTEQQQSDYLPKLAQGEYVPCFALTEPNAGSDAVSIKAQGEVFEQNGELAIRLNFDKRYISMAPVANLIGLAFNLFDPENLLGKGTDVGITCALVHKSLSGVSIGDHHDPNGAFFPNGPIYGKDVIISVNDIIGGTEKAGQGWQMLMEALSGGRAISLPAQATGIAKQMLRITSQYSSLRQQFKVPVNKFQGVSEVLTNMMSRCYSMEAMRTMVCGAVDQGQKPAVASAMIKYNHTELCRKTIFDAMDILAGKAIMRGPKSIIGDNYRTAPIGVTVEGANILTRTLIQFGQGAVRCHPYIQKELNALLARDDKALLTLGAKHIGYTAKNLLKAGVSSLTRGLFLSSKGQKTKRLEQKIAWASNRFALIADLALLCNGPNMKKRGSLSGRLGDCMSYLLYSIAVIKRVNETNASTTELQLAKWTVEKMLHQFDLKLDEVLLNFDVKGVNWLTRYVWRVSTKLTPIARHFDDRSAIKFTRDFLNSPKDLSLILGNDLYEVRPEDNDALSALHIAFNTQATVFALLEGKLASHSIDISQPEKAVAQTNDALTEGLINQEEANAISQFIQSLANVIDVDSFTTEQYQDYSIKSIC